MYKIRAKSTLKLSRPKSNLDFIYVAGTALEVLATDIVQLLMANIGKEKTKEFFAAELNECNVATGDHATVNDNTHAANTSEGDFFVMLSTSDGGFTTMMDGDDIAKFKTFELAYSYADDNPLGEHYGFEIFERGHGCS